MEQEKIMYGDIMALGFKEVQEEDNVFFNQYGYPYSIVSLDLTNKISLDWYKPTQLCSIIRVDNKEDNNVLKEKPIHNLTELKEVIDFFTGK